MTMKIFIPCVLLLLLPLAPEMAVAQSSSSSSQQQEFSNTQQITSGNQTVVLQSPYYSPPVRSFSIPGGNPLPPHLPVPSHFAPPVTDGNFGSLTGMLGYKDTFSEDEAGALMQDHGKVRVITTCYIPKDLRNSKRSLKLLTDAEAKANGRYEQIGIGNYKALDTDSISEQILGIAITEGLKIGADAMVFQEGAALTQIATGYSIGLFNSFSFVNDGSGNGTGNVGVGGIGYGKGQTGYFSKPWLRIIFFREVAPTAARPPKPPKDVALSTEAVNYSGYDNPMINPSEEGVLRMAQRTSPPQEYSIGLPERVDLRAATLEQKKSTPDRMVGPPDQEAQRSNQKLPASDRQSRPQEQQPARSDRAGGRESREVLREEKPAQKGYYQAKDGDTLAGIAAKKEVYGSPLKWAILYRLNYEIFKAYPISEELPDMKIPDGTKLRIHDPAEIEENLRKRSQKLMVVNVLSATTNAKIIPIMAQLVKHNYPVYLSSAKVKEKDWIRIRVGFFKERAEAEAESKRIMTITGIRDSWESQVGPIEFEQFAGY